MLLRFKILEIENIVILLDVSFETCFNERADLTEKTTHDKVETADIQQ